MKSSDKSYPDSFPIASGNLDPVAGSITHLLQLLDRPIAFHRCFRDPHRVGYGRSHAQSSPVLAAAGARTPEGW